jgi:hypothetical protein
VTVQYGKSVKQKGTRGSLYVVFYIIIIIIICHLLQTVVLRVHARHIRDTSLFDVYSSSKKIVLLLDGLQRLMLFAMKLTHLGPELFYFIFVVAVSSN